MSQNVILVYGNKENISEELVQVDVSKPNWIRKIPESGKVLCDRSAYIYAIKVLSSERIAKNVEELYAEEVSVQTKEKKPESHIAAVSCKDILVSSRYHKACEDHKVWLSTYHVKMINKMLGAGCKITLLDEENNIIKELE